MGWYEDRRKDTRNAQRILMANPLVKRPTGRARRR